MVASSVRPSDSRFGLYIRSNLSSFRRVVANLTQLDLDYNGYGPIPPELGRLANLRVLDLYPDQLSGAIPLEPGKLANLRELDLTWNQSSGPVPSELGKLANLRQLDLSSNQLSSALPRSLMRLRLWRFGFDNTNLCEPPDDAFQAWLASIDELQGTGLLCKCAYLPAIFIVQAPPR